MTASSSESPRLPEDATFVPQHDMNRSDRSIYVVPTAVAMLFAAGGAVEMHKILTSPGAPFGPEARAVSPEKAKPATGVADNNAAPDGAKIE